MMIATRVAPWILLALTLAGCRNDCQQVCLEMADLFDACGQDYSQDDLVQCLETYEEPDGATLLTCQDTLGELETLLEYKAGTGDACDEIGRYAAP